jgi:quercetin dioxygenase-like cupin family protein
MLIVAAGGLRLRVGKHSYDLAAGDAIEFAADQPHSYANGGRTVCIAYNVLVYA